MPFRAFIPRLLHHLLPAILRSSLILIHKYPCSILKGRLSQFDLPL
uniref:Uncharacterized protein n=1 Tax=Oryza rufipogon TaxID=4529 RepID=A0A0E0PIZ7_ORYRU